MQELDSLVKNNYRSHPAFSFNRASLECPVDSVEAFNQVYKAACQFTTTLGKTSRKLFQQDLLRSLDAVFDFFETQSGDQYETQFLFELRIECIRVLNDELTWYFRQLRRGLVDLIDHDIRKDAVRLQSQRYFFGNLSPTTNSELLNLAKPDLERFRVNAAVGRLKREDLSVNSGPVVRAMCDVLTREFKRSGTLDAISAYTGIKHSIGLACELSVPQATWWRNTIDALDAPPMTLYAHLDEALSVPKAIVYLSDVTEQNGPTGCYPNAYEAMNLNPLQEIIGRVIGAVGAKTESPLKDYYAKSYHQSMNSERFRRHFMRIP